MSVMGEGRAPTSTDQAATTRTYPAYAHPLWRRLLLSRETGVIALVVIISMYGYSNIPYFGETLTLTYLLLDMTTILLIALPMTLVIITGEIDLSVASVVGLSSALIGLLHQNGFGMAVSCVIALTVGVVCGAFNGFLIAYVGLPSLAVTIGTLALYRGIAVGLLGTTAVTDFPTSWTQQAANVIGSTGIPTVIILFVVLAAAFITLLHFTSFGRGIYDIGLSSEAAQFTGVDVKRTKFVFRVTRAHGYEAGEYQVTIRDGRSGDMIGAPARLIFQGENEIIDRRAMVFAGSDKKKKKSAEEVTTVSS